MALFRGEYSTDRMINGTDIPSPSGVSKIIAGSGVTIVPTAGTGEVTVSASGGGGGITGLTPGVYPVAASSTTIADGMIDFGISATGVLAIKNTDPSSFGMLVVTAKDFDAAITDAPISIVAGAGLTLENDVSTSPASGIQITNNGDNGTIIDDTGAGGILLHGIGAGGINIQDSATSGPGLQLKGSAGMHILTSHDFDAGITNSNLIIAAGAGLQLQNGPAATVGTGVSISNSSDSSTIITDAGGGGILLQDTGDGGITLQSSANNISVIPGAGVLKVTGPIVPQIVYSAAGTPLPAASVGIGARAFVSDATANAYGTNYASGGAIKAPVYSDGTNWNMG